MPGDDDSDGGDVFGDIWRVVSGRGGVGFIMADHACLPMPLSPSMPATSIIPCYSMSVA